MVSDDKKAELLFKQSELSMNKFFNRQGYEWKFSYALWTALAIIIGFAIKGGEFKSEPRLLFIGALSVISPFIIYTHKIFLDGVGKTHGIDKAYHHGYEKELNGLLGVDFEKDHDGHVAKAKKSLRQGERNGKWARRPYLIITLLLLLILFSVLVTTPK